MINASAPVKSWAQDKTVRAIFGARACPVCQVSGFSIILKTHPQNYNDVSGRGQAPTYGHCYFKLIHLFACLLPLEAKGSLAITNFLYSKQIICNFSWKKCDIIPKTPDQFDQGFPKFERVMSRLQWRKYTGGWGAQGETASAHPSLAYFSQLVHCICLKLRNEFGSNRKIYTREEGSTG